MGLKIRLRMQVARSATELPSGSCRFLLPEDLDSIELGGSGWVANNRNPLGGVRSFELCERREESRSWRVGG